MEQPRWGPWSLFFCSAMGNTATDRTLLIHRIIVERSLSSRLIYAGTLAVKGRFTPGEVLKRLPVRRECP